MKSNIEIVKDYLAGVRPIIQVGYTGEVNKHRNEGETWTDSKGIQWQRKDGKNVRLTKTQGDIIREAIGDITCRQCGLQYKWGSRKDGKFLFRTGLCMDCLIDYETKLRVLGIFSDYEMYKLASNELGAMKDMEAKIEETLAYFRSGDTDVKMLCNSAGFTERWKTTNVEEIITNAESDLKAARERIEALTKIRDEYKEKYTEEATKSGLEVLCQPSPKSPTKT